MSLSIQLGKDIWRFSRSDQGELPSLPVSHYGELKSPKEPDKYLYYALDKNYQIWLGLRKGKDIILEYFSPSMAMDILYNYNLLAWVSVAELIPEDIYKKMREK